MVLLDAPLVDLDAGVRVSQRDRPRDVGPDLVPLDHVPGAAART